MNRGQRRAGWRAQLRERRAASAPRPAAIQLRIEELRLSGFEPSAGRHIADGLRGQLTALISRQGLPGGWMKSTSFEEAAAPKLEIGRGMKPQSVAENLARSILEAKAVERK